MLRQWTVSGSAEQPQGIREALEQSRNWYQRGQGDPDHPGFSPYNAQNRLALEAVLGIAQSADAKSAIDAGKIAHDRYDQSRDYFDLIMGADGLLIARLIDGSLQQQASETLAAECAIVECYQSLRDKLPETERSLDSVLSQIELLAKFYQLRGDDPGTAVSQSLNRIHEALNTQD